MSEHEDIQETPRWFALEKKAMVAELRLLIIASVALNQFLAHVVLPTAITIPAITAALLAPVAKGALGFFR